MEGRLGLTIQTDSPVVVTSVGEEPPLDCVKCKDNPVITGNLKGRFEANSPQTEPPCDDTWKNQIGWQVRWNNEYVNEQDGEDYTKGPTDASAYAAVEVFDEVVRAGSELVAFITNFPRIVAEAGITALDDQIRKIADRVKKVVDGKLDVAGLLGEVEWRFALRQDSNVKIKHSQEWLAFRNDPSFFVNNNGIYNFTARVLVDGKGEKDLEIPTEQERRMINGASEGQPLPERLNKTRKKEGSSTEKAMQLSEGSHVIKVSYDLKAGYGGVPERAKDDVKNTFTRA